MYLIKWTYGKIGSGVLPGIFRNRQKAQDECDFLNKMYNNVHHYVE